MAKKLFDASFMAIRLGYSSLSSTYNWLIMVQNAKKYRPQLINYAFFDVGSLQTYGSNLGFLVLSYVPYKKSSDHQNAK